VCEQLNGRSAHTKQAHTEQAQTQWRGLQQRGMLFACGLCGLAAAWHYEYEKVVRQICAH
jgi:hypothetical protein